MESARFVGNYEAAVEGFRRASRLRPNKNSHYTCLGKVYLRWGGHESQALEALEESLRLEHTKVAENLAVKAQVAIARAEQGQHAPPEPHPPHRSPEHLTQKGAAPAPVQDFSKPPGPLVKMSSARVLGLLRSDSGMGGVAMISSGDSIAGDEPKGGSDGDGGGGGDGGSKQSVGRDDKPRTKVKAGRNRSSDVGSLHKLMQGRIHFDDDSDGGSVKGSPPPPPLAGRVPPPQSKRKGRHRRRRSNGSISSLMEVESVGIVGSSIPTGPPAAAAAAGTGVVARAVARVEEGSPVVGDGAPGTKKAVTVGTPTVAANEMPEDAASVPRRIAMLKQASAKAQTAVSAGGRPRTPPPPYCETTSSYAAASAVANGEDRGSTGGGARQKLSGGRPHMAEKAGSVGSSFASMTSSAPDGAVAVGGRRESGRGSGPLPKFGGGEPGAASGVRGTRDAAAAGRRRKSGRGSGSVPSVNLGEPGVANRVHGTRDVAAVGGRRESGRGSGSVMSVKSGEPGPGSGVHNTRGATAAAAAAATSAAPASAGEARGEAASDSLSADSLSVDGDMPAMATPATTSPPPCPTVSVPRAGVFGKVPAPWGPGGGPANRAAPGDDNLPPPAVVAEASVPRAAVVETRAGVRGRPEAQPVLVPTAAEAAVRGGRSPSASPSPTKRAVGVLAGDGSDGLDSDSDESDSGGSALLSNLAALEAVAKFARGEGRPVAAVAAAAAVAAGRPEHNAAALAAIAAGAAPVKWGREGAAERRAKAAAEGSGNAGSPGAEGDEPPDFSPLASHRRSGGSSTAGFSTTSGSSSGRQQWHAYGKGGGNSTKSINGDDNNAAFNGRLETGDIEQGEERERGRRWTTETAAAEYRGAANGGESTVPPPPSYTDAQEAEWLGVLPHAAWAEVAAAGGTGETARLQHKRRSSDGLVSFQDDGSGADGGTPRSSSLRTLGQRRRGGGGRRIEVFLDNEEGEWGQTPRSRFRLFWWPGRNRHVPVGVCLDSPNVARSSWGSKDAKEGAKRFAWDTEGEGDADCNGGHSAVGSERRIDARFSSSTESALLCSEVAAQRGATTGRNPTNGQQVAAAAGGGRFHHLGPSPRAATAAAAAAVSGGGGRNGAGEGGGKNRLRRWVHGKRHTSEADGIPSEQLVEKWIRAVLGPRALGLVEEKRDYDDDGPVGSGGRGLGEELKDGRLLVRLAHAVGGARAASCAEDLEATTPMLQLVNVHAFMAAARAIGVPATSLFHAKDLVDGPPGGPCSPAVLKCLSALSDAARRNASIDPPGTAYDGPLLGDGESDYDAKTTEENGSAGGLTASAGGSGGGGGGGSIAGGGGGGGRRVFWRLSSKGSNSSGWTESDLDRGRGAAGKFRDGFAEEMPPPSPGSAFSVGRARDA
ncbi:unnamed protein product [Ectocarpus sp. CCAP 1310/34]|nr:unnamed protein product [Ectocarpus sp. CCAP 1310/34]